MGYKFRIGQDELSYLYEHAKGRMDFNPEIAEKYKKIIKEIPFYKSEKEALEFTVNDMKNSNSISKYRYQIWVEIEKDNDIFRVTNKWFVTDDNIKAQAAEYIGMAQMYDNCRLTTIIIDNIPLDDVIAYF